MYYICIIYVYVLEKDRSSKTVFTLCTHGREIVSSRDAPLKKYFSVFKSFVSTFVLGCRESNERKLGTLKKHKGNKECPDEVKVVIASPNGLFT
jgi:hypothetical protein